MAISYTHEQFKGDIIEMARQMHRDNFFPDVVAGISRGGLVPAVYFGQWFQVPVVEIRCSLRDQKEDVNLYHLRKNVGKKILVVDDIIDGGETMRRVNEHDFLGRQKFASMWLNTAQDFSPNYYAREINRLEDESWINFPWENFWISA